MRVFSQYFEGKPAGLNPPSIIRATPLFQQLRTQINQVGRAAHDIGAVQALEVMCSHGWDAGVCSIVRDSTPKSAHLSCWVSLPHQPPGS
jgi:hypothetical protein